MKLTKYDKQLLHDNILANKRIQRNKFMEAMASLEFVFYANVSFFYERENPGFLEPKIKNIKEIISFYEENDLVTRETNKTIIKNIFPTRRNTKYAAKNVFVNDYIVKLAFANYLGFSNDFYWEHIEKDLSKISYGIDNEYYSDASYNFLSHIKHLYSNLENNSLQLSIVNKCILNIYYTYNKKRDRTHFRSSYQNSFCGVLEQLQSYKDIFRATSLLEKKLFNNMQRRINKDIVDLKIKGKWKEKIN